MKLWGSTGLVLSLLILCACGGVEGGTRRDEPGPGNGGGAQGDMTALNHVIVFMQENRSFDSYFWDMTNYRQRNNIPIVSADGRIRDGSDPAAAAMQTNNISPLTNQPIPPHHMASQCTENLTPDWNESHKAMNNANPAAAGPGSPMDGFVRVAADIAQFYEVIVDQTGSRAMGYFTDQELNYYYFMASNFALSDMLFSPVPTRTASNRLYFHAATSQGYIHADTSATQQLNAKTIWRALDEKGVSWKIYVTDWDVNQYTFFNFFTDSNDPARRAKIVSINEYFTDVQNGTLPNVAFIETGMLTGRDEHPTNNPDVGVPVPESQAIHVQSGAAWAAELINALMRSQSWRDSAFIWIFDEGGGAFDHVPPIAVPPPDGIKPVDLDPTKDCFDIACSSYDFNITGFRVPNFIVSPFARKNFVSHTPMDFTAILKLIETRWSVQPLTARDAAMPNMLEFFDFRNGGPWATPPTPPAQRTDAPCNFTLQ